MPSRIPIAADTWQPVELAAGQTVVSVSNLGPTGLYLTESAAAPPLTAVGHPINVGQIPANFQANVGGNLLYIRVVAAGKEGAYTTGIE